MKEITWSQLQHLYAMIPFCTRHRLKFQEQRQCVEEGNWKRENDAGDDSGFNTQSQWTDCSGFF